MGSAFLPPGGHFTLTRSKSFIDQIVNDEGQKPGPGSYSHSSMPMPQGGRFNQSNPKSDIDWLVYHAKQRPGPGEYAPKRLSSDGGVIGEARSKSALDWEVYRAEQIPGPGEYEHSSMCATLNYFLSLSAYDTKTDRAYLGMQAFTGRR